MRRLSLAIALWLVTAPVAQARPTSGDLSILSGRTIGIGEVSLAAAIGWPGIWVQALFAPSSTFNIGLRGTVLYGSPIMGLGGGIGGEAAAPMRLHLFGKDKLDIALALTPSVVLGQGALVGEEGAFADDFGFGVVAEPGILAGIHASESLTLTLGAAGSVAYLDVSGSSGSHIVGTAVFIAALEALVSRDTMLFAEARGGYGFAPEGLFDGHAIVRLGFGLAYLL